MTKRLNELAVGAKVCDPLSKYNNAIIPFVVADKNHAGYPSNSVTLMTEKSISVKIYDAAEGGSGTGLGRYTLSNIRQWLNKSGLPWFTYQHSGDAAPNSGNAVLRYANETGFLTGFAEKFKNSMLATTLTCATYPADAQTSLGSETFSDKFFLPSMTECGQGDNSGVSEGSVLPIFAGDAGKIRGLTYEAYQIGYNNNLGQYFGSIDNCPYLLRSSSTGYPLKTFIMKNRYSTMVNADSYAGVTALCNLPGITCVTENPNADGYYEIIWNQPPTTPPGISVPNVIKSGKNVSIGWSASLDSDGDAVTYELQRSADQGTTWTTIYSGVNTAYTDTGVAASMDHAMWRVRAVDTNGGYSDYTASQVRTVIHNADPTISGEDAALGLISTPPSVNFAVNDADADDVLTVYKYLDGVEIGRINSAVRETVYSFTLSAQQFFGLGSGIHTMKILVKDSVDNYAERSATFSRTVSKIDVKMVPVATTEMARKILISLRAQATAANVLLQVCNNALDESPTWETVTTGTKHAFTNITKTASSWAIGVRVEITKQDADEVIILKGLSGAYSFTADAT